MYGLAKMLSVTTQTISRNIGKILSRVRFYPKYSFKLLKFVNFATFKCLFSKQSSMMQC